MRCARSSLASSIVTPCCARTDAIAGDKSSNSLATRSTLSTRALNESPTAAAPMPSATTGPTAAPAAAATPVDSVVAAAPAPAAAADRVAVAAVAAALADSAVPPPMTNSPAVVAAFSNRFPMEERLWTICDSRFPTEVFANPISSIFRSTLDANLSKILVSFALGCLSVDIAVGSAFCSGRLPASLSTASINSSIDSINRSSWF